MFLFMCHDRDVREMCIKSTLSFRIEQFPMDFWYPNLLQVLFPVWLNSKLIVLGATYSRIDVQLTSSRG
jgi:hypothetical protein